MLPRRRSSPPPRPLESCLCAITLLALVAALGAGCRGSVEDRLAEVRALQDAGQFNESIEPLRELLARSPDLAEANYLLGVALVQTGQPSLAVWPLEKAAAAPDQRVEAGLLLATTFLGLQSYDDAVRVSTKVLDAKPDTISALRVRAQALLGANRRKDALQDTTKLIELAPDDFDAWLTHATILAELGMMDDAEKAHERLEEVSAKSADRSLAVRGCLARALFFKDNVKDDKRAEEHYKLCLAKAPTDPLALRLVTQFYDDQGKSDESMQLWAAAVKAAPDNMQFRAALAGRYESSGKVDDARKIFTDGVEQVGTAQAWATLADFERRSGHPDKALEAIDQAIRLQPSAAENLQYMRADVLVDLGKLDEAQTLVDQMKEPSFRDLLKGRVLLARGQAQAALVAFESGLKRWPNNAGGRYLAGLAARDLGDYERASAEFRESLRADPHATDAALMLASLELARGQYRDAQELGRLYVKNRGGTRPEGYLVLVRASLAQHMYDAAHRNADALAKAGFAREAAMARAEIEAKQLGADAAIHSLQKSGLDLDDPANEVLLRLLVEQLVETGRTDEALATVARAKAAQPQAASIEELGGTVLLRAKRYPEAAQAFERALALDPKLGRAKMGQAELALAAGDPQKAIALYDEAARLMAPDVSAAYAAAQLVLASGDRTGAKQRLEEIVRRDPGQAGPRNDLAWLLAQQNEDLDRALRLAEFAHRIDPSPEITDTLGTVYLQRGELDRAVQAFDEALKARPDSSSIRYRLGLALARQGEHQRAQESFQQALAGGAFPEADAARSELAKLEQK